MPGANCQTSAFQRRYTGAGLEDSNLHRQTDRAHRYAGVLVAAFQWRSWEKALLARSLLTLKLLSEQLCWLQ